MAKKAAEYSSGGRKITSTSSGSSSTSGSPGMKPSTSPPTTSTIGYGMSDRARGRAEHRDRHEQADEDQLDVVHQADLEADRRRRPLALDDLAALEEQGEVAEQLGRREAGLRETPRSPTCGCASSWADRGRSTSWAPDLLRAAHVPLEALVDQLAVARERLAVAREHRVGLPVSRVLLIERR